MRHSITELAGGWRYYFVFPGKLWPHEMSRPYPTREAAETAARSNADRLDTP